MIVWGEERTFLKLDFEANNLYFILFLFIFYK